jgi:hypothetical protein
MMPIIVWGLAIAIGMSLSSLAGIAALWSSAVAASIVLGTFAITRLFKVADHHDVSKMHTAWLTQELRKLVWRMLLTLTLAGIAFKMAYPVWGVPFWISVAVFYQIGLLLHLREIRRRPTEPTTTQ